MHYTLRMWFQAKDISYSHNQNLVLNNLSLALEPGKIYGVLGTNGAGKSTLLQILAGLLDADEGTVHIDSDRVLGPAYHLVPGHPAIALVKQDSRLHPLHTVSENLRYVLRALDEKDQKGKMEELSSLLNLERNWDRQIKYLSGGEQQRVAIAAALAKNPSLLLLDEPFSQTDALVKQELRGYLKGIVESLGICILFVSHDAQDALSLADHLFILQDGKVAEEGRPWGLYFYPKHKETAHLTGICNWIPKDKLASPARFHAVGSHVLLRPDQIWVSIDKGEYDVEAQVISIEFGGPCQLVTFYFPSMDITIKAVCLSSISLVKGAKAFVSFIAPRPLSNG